MDSTYSAGVGITSMLAGAFSPDGRFLATTAPTGVRVLGLLDDDRDSTISMWRCTVREGGFSPVAIVPTLLLIRRDRAGASTLSLWTPGGCRELGATFTGDVDAWWGSDGRILVRGIGDGPGGLFVVDPAVGAVLAA